MSYAMDYSPVAAQASQSARAAFIRRTYGHLAGAILAFIGLEAIFQQLPNVQEIAMTMMGSQAMWLVVLLAFMGVAWLAERLAQSDASPGVQYMGLALYTVAESIIFIPLIYIANTFFPNAIATAGILTLGIFAGLTLTVFLTRGDFSFLRPIICVGSMLALGFIIAAILFGFTLGLIFCFAVVALMSACILYYTSQIMLHYRTDRHVAAALALFASIATMFYYVLLIVMGSSRD